MHAAFDNHLAAPLRYVKVHFVKTLNIQISDYLQPTPSGVWFRGRVVKSLRILATVHYSPVDTQRIALLPSYHRHHLRQCPSNLASTSPIYSTVISKSPYRRQGVSFLTQGAHNPLGGFFCILDLAASFLMPKGI